MKVSTEIIVFLALIVILCVNKEEKMTRYCLISMIILALVHILRSRTSVFKLSLLDMDGMNEVLLLETMLGQRCFLFLLDTGYAGPPVLSKSYLATEDPIHLSLKERYRRIMRALPAVTEDDENVAINDYIGQSRCIPFTSGCTMKLMSIGSTQEQQADMLLCPMLRMRNVHHGMFAPKSKSNTRADVFVTNSLKRSVHILTCDFLLHHSPCLISIGACQMELDLSPARFMSLLPQFTRIPAEFSGGSFVIPFELPNGDTLRCTMDTGAPGPICLGVDVLGKIKSCTLRDRKSLQQNGVNGERICSEIVETDLAFLGVTYKVPVFINNSLTDGVDGYVGMAFLRAFDLLITPSDVGFRKNSRSMKTIDDFHAFASSGGCGLPMECLRPEKQ